MKKQTLGKIGAVASVALGFSALVWTDDGPLRGNTLAACVVDVRPRRDTQIPTNSGEDLWEAQVYWMKWAEPGANKYGTEFAIEVPRDDLLIMGDGNGGDAGVPEVPPTPGNPGVQGGEEYLEAAHTYLVRVYWNNTTGQKGAKYVWSLDNGLSWSQEFETISKGEFDLLEMAQPPLTEFVNREDQDREKRRIRLWSRDRGVSIAITLSDV